MFDQHANLAYGIVLTAPSPAGSGTSVTLQSGQGAAFPDPAAGAYNITIWPAGGLPTTSTAEIARVTARSGDVLTIVRAQEGTTARTVLVGDWVALTVTAKLMTDVENGTSGLRFGAQTLTFAGAAPAAQTLVDGTAPTVLASVAGVTSGTATVNLPAPVLGAATPYPGSEFVVVDEDGAAATTNINVSPNGATIGGSSSAKTITDAYGSRRFRFRSALQQKVLGYSPSLYWRLGDAAGAASVADASGNGHTGAPGAGVTLGQTGLLYGDATTCALFANSSASAVTAAAYAPFVVGSQRTFMGVANRTASADIDYLVAGSISAASGGSFLRCQAGSEDVFFANGNSAGVTWAAAWPGVGQDVLWALTYDDTTRVAELFINGVSKGTRTLGVGAGYSGVANDFFQVGALGPGAGTGAWGGTQQDVAVFESILTAAEILSVYNYYGWVHLTDDVTVAGAQTVTGAKAFSASVAVGNASLGTHALDVTGSQTVSGSLAVGKATDPAHALDVVGDANVDSTHAFMVGGQQVAPSVQFVYDNANAPAAGGTATAATATWTNPMQSGATHPMSVLVICVGAAGGGGGGQSVAAASAAAGGGGGGGGGTNSGVFRSTDLGNTETITVGGAGGGGNAAGAGGDGGLSSFGSWIQGGGGGGGLAGAGGAAVFGGAGGAIGSAVGTSAGAPAAAAGTTAGGTLAASSGSVGTASPTSDEGGTGGGGGTVGATGVHGGWSVSGGCGGGGGGGHAAGAGAQSGGEGGYHIVVNTGGTQGIAPGGAGGAGKDPNTWGTGTATSVGPYTGSGGGGGASHTTGTGGKGGAGGKGSGGGGGGAGATGGAGANGGAGRVIVIAW